MPEPADTPEPFERETYRIWDWDQDGRVVQLDATVDLFYLPVGHPENDKPFPRPEFNFVSLKRLDGQDHPFTDQMRRSIYLAIETSIQQELLESETEDLDAGLEEAEGAAEDLDVQAGPPHLREAGGTRTEGGAKEGPDDPSQNKGQTKGRSKRR